MSVQLLDHEVAQRGWISTGDANHQVMGASEKEDVEDTGDGSQSVRLVTQARAGTVLNANMDEGLDGPPDSRQVDLRVVPANDPTREKCRTSRVCRRLRDPQFGGHCVIGYASVSSQ